VTATSAQFLIAFVVAGAIGTAVFFHAERNRIKHPSLWASLVFLFLIVALPAYVVHVRRVRRRRVSTGERWPSAAERTRSPL